MCLSSFLYESNSLEQSSLTNKLWHQHGIIFHWTSIFTNNAAKTSNHYCILSVYLNQPYKWSLLAAVNNLQISVTNQNPLCSCYKSQHVYFDYVNAHPLSRAIIMLLSDTSQPQNCSCKIYWKCMKQTWSTMGWIKYRYTHLCYTCHISSK